LTLQDCVADTKVKHQTRDYPVTDEDCCFHGGSPGWGCGGSVA
jgi:hypothetical protein